MEELGQSASDQHGRTRAPIGIDLPLPMIEACLVEDLEFTEHWREHLEVPLFRSTPDGPPNAPLPLEEMATALAWQSRRVARTSALARALALHLEAQPTPRLTVFAVRPQPQVGTLAQVTQEHKGETYTGWHLLEIACSALIAHSRTYIHGPDHMDIARNVAQVLDTLLHAAGMDGATCPILDRATTASAAPMAPDSSASPSTVNPPKAGSAPSLAQLGSAARYVWEFALTLRRIPLYAAERNLLTLTYQLGAPWFSQYSPRQDAGPWRLEDILSFAAHFGRTRPDVAPRLPSIEAAQDELHRGSLNQRLFDESPYARACVEGLRDRPESAVQALAPEGTLSKDLQFMHLLWMEHDPDLTAVLSRIRQNPMIASLLDCNAAIRQMSEHRLAAWQSPLAPQHGSEIAGLKDQR